MFPKCGCHGKSLTSGADSGIMKKETLHTKDDPMRGVLGSAEESHPYEKEIEFAKSLGEYDVVKQLEFLRESERKAIYDG